MNRRVFISESKRCVFQIFATKPLVLFLLANFHVYVERQDIRVFISQPVNREVVYFVLASDLSSPVLAQFCRIGNHAFTKTIGLAILLTNQSACRILVIL